MKNFSILSLSLLALFGFAVAQPKTYDADKAHSSVGFTVTHMSVSEVTGAFTDYSATIAWDEKSLASSKIDVTLPVSNIDTKQVKRDQHLQAADFFDAAKFPTIRVVSKSFQAIGSNQYNVTADVTIRGTTKSLTFPITVSPEIQNPMSKAMVRGFVGNFKLNRKDFKVGESFPNLMVSDEVTVRFGVQAGRK